MSKNQNRIIITRRGFLAAGAATIAMPMLIGKARADAKTFRISTPGSPEEWQSKALEVFKTELDKSAAGQFDVQIHLNGTLFGQGTEIEAMQRGNLECALVSPQDIAKIIPEYSIFTTGYLIRSPQHLDAVYDGDIGKEVDARVAKAKGDFTAAMQRQEDPEKFFDRDLSAARQAAPSGAA